MSTPTPPAETKTALAHRCHPETRVSNAAQERLRLASDSFGAASRVHVRYFDREGRDEAHEGFALVTWEPDGGDVNTELLGDAGEEALHRELLGTAYDTMRADNVHFPALKAAAQTVMTWITHDRATAERV
ncbi:hypothetical protein AB0I84_29190 [Streptomyces spectabilis]|uniref:phage tail tube protein n=1 Tax=Streptomyces spectabilis TaxID=68270 RepID=UPI0033DBB5A5